MAVYEDSGEESQIQPIADGLQRVVNFGDDRLRGLRVAGFKFWLFPLTLIAVLTTLSHCVMWANRRPPCRRGMMNHRTRYATVTLMQLHLFSWHNMSVKKFAQKYATTF